MASHSCKKEKIIIITPNTTTIVRISSGKIWYPAVLPVNLGNHTDLQTKGIALFPNLANYPNVVAFDVTLRARQQHSSTGYLPN